MGKPSGIAIWIIMTWTMPGRVEAQFALQDFCSGMMHYHQVAQLKDSDPRMDGYDVKCYHLELELTNLNANLKGTAVITSEIRTRDLPDFVIELDDQVQVDSVLVDSEKVTFQHNNDLITASLQDPPDSGSLLNVTIFYQAESLQDGLFNGTDRIYNNQVTWTLSEPLSAKYWYPVKQVLDDKADSVKISVITDQGLRAGSNGLLTGTELLDGGKIRYDWVSKYPIAYYLLSVAVSNYQELNIYAQPGGRTDSLLIQNYVYDHPDYLPANVGAINKTIDLIHLFSELFTLYPFYDEKYGHCLTPAGPYMEHQTMSSMRDFNYRIVAHELAHQWFGDQVTCGTWQDIWINEGFASYAEYLGFEQLGMMQEAGAWLTDATDHALNEPDGSVYIPFEELWDPGRLFNYRLTYRKGALLLHMIRFELNDDALFFSILRQFQSEYKNGVAIGLDFKEVIERLSGRDFSEFFDQWYFGRGYPTYDIVWDQDYDSLWIHSVQIPSSLETPLFKMPLEFRVIMETKDTLLRVNQLQNDERFLLKVDERVLNIIMDPDQWSLFSLRSMSRYNDPDHPVTDPFIVYPNPATDHIRLDFFGNMADKTIQIINLTGRLETEYSTAGAFSELDVRHLSPGIYLIKVMLPRDTWTGKFIKK